MRKASAGGTEKPKRFFISRNALFSDDEESAKKWVNKLLKIEPNNKFAHLTLAKLYINEDDDEAAYKEYLLVRDIDPSIEEAEEFISGHELADRPITPYRGDLYDQIRQNKDKYSRAAIQLIDKLKIDKRKGVVLARPGMIVGLLLILFSFSLATMALFQASATYNVTMTALRKQEQNRLAIRLLFTTCNTKR